MKIATWNVNSVRARAERLMQFLQRHQPDIVCLQELKVVNDVFPFAALADLGYHAAVHGQKAYNGVAILARQPLTCIQCDLGDDIDDGQARLIAANVGDLRIISVYVPNGQSRTSDKYLYKLSWMRRLRAHLDAHYTPQQPLLIAGDFNVAPRATDVEKPDVWDATVLCHPDVRRHLEDIVAWGLVDVLAKHHPLGGVYSWWDYRMLGFAKNNGLRIDMIYATDVLACRTVDASVDRDERRGNLPSDHAPVLATFAWPPAP